MRRLAILAGFVALFVLGLTSAWGGTSMATNTPKPRQVTVKVVVAGMGPAQRRAQKRGTVRLEVLTPGVRTPVCGRLRWYIGGPDPQVEDRVPAGWNKVCNLLHRVVSLKRHNKVDVRFQAPLGWRVLQVRQFRVTLHTRVIVVLRRVGAKPPKPKPPVQKLPVQAELQCPTGGLGTLRVQTARLNGRVVSVRQIICGQTIRVATLRVNTRVNVSLLDLPPSNVAVLRTAQTAQVLAGQTAVFVLEKLGSPQPTTATVVTIVTTPPPTTTTVTTTAPTTTTQLPANQRPVADAGAPQELALQGGSVTFTLNGSNSRDPDGRITSFVWTGTVDPADVERPTVTVRQPGVYTFRLTVTDDRGATDTDDTTVSVIGEPPG